MNKTLIVFDIDGTLTDSVPIHHNAFREALLQLGATRFDDRFDTYTHHTDQHIARVIYETATQKRFDEQMVNRLDSILFRLISAHPIPEIAGAANFVSQLINSKEYAVCFATGSMHQPAVYKLQSAGIKWKEELLVAANGIEERENIVRKAIEQAKHFYHTPTFTRIISMGDGIWDLLTAQHLGIEFIGIGDKNKTLMEANGMKKHLPDFTHLTPRLLQQKFL